MRRLKSITTSITTAIVAVRTRNGGHHSRYLICSTTGNDLMCARRRLRLTPLQRDILWILEEAGEEHVTTLLNTLARTLTSHQRRHVLDATYAALDALFRAGLVESEYERQISDLNTSPGSFPDFRSLVVWDENSRYWKWNERLCGRQRLMCVLTDDGRAVLTE